MITNYEKSVSIYETGGQYAVYKAVEKDIYMQIHGKNVCHVKIKHHMK